MRLYCLPHAGGSANVYLTWRRHLAPAHELAPVELSGRGRRLSEPLRDSFGDALDDAVDEVSRAPLATEYALFGHSFGALLAFELAHALVAHGYPQPLRLFVSASCAPQRVGELAIPLADENRELLESLAYLGGTPDEILDNAEAVELFAPILRADLRALFGYRYVPRPRLHCPISIILGSNDDVATGVDAALWAGLTDGQAETRVIEGGHFAAFEEAAEIASYVNDALESDACARTARWET